jgi:hypothetical protein
MPSLTAVLLGLLLVVLARPCGSAINAVTQLGWPPEAASPVATPPPPPPPPPPTDHGLIYTQYGDEPIPIPFLPDLLDIFSLFPSVFTNASAPRAQVEAAAERLELHLRGWRERGPSHTHPAPPPPWSHVFHLQLGYHFMAFNTRKGLLHNILAHVHGVLHGAPGYAGIGLFNVAKIRMDAGGTADDALRDLARTRHEWGLDDGSVEATEGRGVDLTARYLAPPVDRLVTDAEGLILRSETVRRTTRWHQLALEMRLAFLSRERRWDEVRELAAELLRLHPRSARALSELGIASYFAGRRGEALDLWGRALARALVTRADTTTAESIVDGIISQHTIDEMDDLIVRLPRGDADDNNNDSRDESDAGGIERVSSSPASLSSPAAGEGVAHAAVRIPFADLVRDQLSVLLDVAPQLHAALEGRPPVIGGGDIDVHRVSLALFRVHPALLLVKAAAVGLVADPDRVEELEAAALTLLRTCALLHAADLAAGGGGGSTSAPTSLPPPLSDPHWAAFVLGRCKHDAAAWHAYWFVHMGRSMLPWRPQESALVASIPARLPAGRTPGYCSDDARHTLCARPLAYRRRPLRVAVSSYDLRRHAFGFIAEGLLRHGAATGRVDYSVWALNGPDTGTLSLLAEGRAIRCRPASLSSAESCVGGSFLNDVDADGAGAVTAYGNESGAAIAIPRIAPPGIEPREFATSAAQTDVLVRLALLLPLVGVDPTSASPDFRVPLPMSLRFFEVQATATDEEVVRAFAHEGIDVLVDAMGATFGGRPGAVALGIPGAAASVVHNIAATTPNADAIFADAVQLPPEGVGARLRRGGERGPVVAAMLEPRVIFTRHTWLLSSFTRDARVECGLEPPMRLERTGGDERGAAEDPLPAGVLFSSRINGEARSLAVIGCERRRALQKFDGAGEGEGGCQGEDEDGPPSPSPPLLLGAFHSFDKVDGVALTLWANLLRANPSARIVLLNSTVPLSLHRARQALAARGVHPNRILVLPRAGHVTHLARQTAVADLILDAPLCNGHTTTAEAIWGGVPVLTLEGSAFHARVASSLLQTAGEGVGRVLVTRSALEYEDVGVELVARRPHLLEALRRRILAASVDPTTPAVHAPTQARDVEDGHRALLEVMAAATAAAPSDCHAVVLTKG